MRDHLMPGIVGKKQPRQNKKGGVGGMYARDPIGLSTGSGDTKKNQGST